MSEATTEAETKRIPTPEELGFDPAELRRKYAEERERRLRADGNNQYREIAGTLEHYNSDPYVKPGFTRPALHEQLDAVIVGGGFGGLAVAQRLKGTGVRITIVDQRNHHLFQPLLYQVGTATLATSEIAWPIRQLFRRRKDITTLLGTAAGVDADAREVLLEDGARLGYDTLVLATGARHAYFGHDEWEPYAPALKTLEDATSIRRRILLSFERAERESDDALRRA